MTESVNQRALELMAMLDAALAHPKGPERERLLAEFRDELWKDRKPAPVKDWAKAAAGDEQ